MEYDVIYGEDYFDLIQKVNHRLQEEKNWQLEGGIAIATSGACYQALVKQDEISATSELTLTIDSASLDELDARLQKIKDAL